MVIAGDAVFDNFRYDCLVYVRKVSK